MATYFIDDGGPGSGDGLAWATAFVSWAEMVAVKGSSGTPFESGDIVYIGADHAEPQYGSALTIYGPASGAPVQIISSTVGSGTTVSYSASSTNQVNTTGGAYDISFNGSFAVYGLNMVAGDDILLDADSNEGFYARGCTFTQGHDKQVYCQTALGIYTFESCTFSGAGDTGSSTKALVSATAQTRVQLSQCSFTNLTNRTGYIIGGVNVHCSGCDFSNVPAATEIIDVGLYADIAYCKTANGNAIHGTNYYSATNVMAVNVGDSNLPAAMAYYNRFCSAITTTSIYRDGGQEINGTPFSWAIVTGSTISEGWPFWTPWMYGAVASTGSATFTVYIGHTIGTDLQDDEIWLEVEYLSEAGEATWARATDQRATVTTAAQDQTDDSTSTWTGIDFEGSGQMQSLAVTATVAIAGPYRARVAIAVASLDQSTHKLHIDPKVTVS